MIQFALSPEDEAMQIAEIAMSDGHKRALVLTPETPWGNRLADTFIQHWTKLGGEIAEQISFIDNTTDFSTPVKELLNIDKMNELQFAEGVTEVTVTSKNFLYIF